MTEKPSSPNSLYLNTLSTTLLIFTPIAAVLAFNLPKDPVYLKPIFLSGEFLPGLIIFPTLLILSVGIATLTQKIDDLMQNNNPILRKISKASAILASLGIPLLVIQGSPENASTVFTPDQLWTIWAFAKLFVLPIVILNLYISFRITKRNLEKISEIKKQFEEIDRNRREG